MNGLKFLEATGIKPEFEVSVTLEGNEVKTVVNGNKLLVEAGVMSIIELIARQEDTTVVDKLEKMLSQAKIAEILRSNTREVTDEKETAELEKDEHEGCDGDCENCDRHEAMPEGIKQLFDALFGAAEEEE